MERKILSRISILFGGLMLLTGCGKREKSDESSKCVNTTSTSASIASPTIVLSTTTLNYPAITTLVTSTSTYTMSTNLITTSTSQMPYMYSDCVYTTCTVTDSDLEILDSFSKMGNSIRDSFDSGELLDKGKSYFIYCVDFLFYDGEIKGIKFDDLTDSAKEQLLLDITTIDSLICSKYPNYKDEIKEGYGDAYNKASEVIKEGSTNINDFSNEKLGEENYNKLKEYKKLFIDTAFGDWDVFVGIVDNGRQKVNEWYSNLKKGTGD